MRAELELSKFLSLTTSMGKVASVAAQAVFYCSLACLAVWLLW